MMKSNSVLKIIIFVFTFLLIFLSYGKSVSATNHCSTLSNAPGTHGPSSRFTGIICRDPAQYNQNTRCIGRGGDRYLVYFCNANGCQEEYPEQGPNAPTLCRRPDPGQSAIGNIFGQVEAPQTIQYFGFGARGISQFLSNLVVLIYSIAAVVLILMLLWGAFDWLTSGGDKEKLENAKKKLINAFVGIMLFAIAFAIIRILGVFTGFTFFSG